VIKEARWSGWVWVGECFFWYRPTRVVPDQRPLNGRCCCCCCCNGRAFERTILHRRAKFCKGRLNCWWDIAIFVIFKMIAVGHRRFFGHIFGPPTMNIWWSLSLCKVCWSRCCSFANITHTPITALFPGLPGWASTRKVRPVWILLKQETVSGRGISWAICKSRQITMPVPYHSSFLQAGCLSCCPTNSVKVLKFC